MLRGKEATVKNVVRRPYCADGEDPEILMARGAGAGESGFSAAVAAISSCRRIRISENAPDALSFFNWMCKARRS
jgi:hypothetical protein